MAQVAANVSCTPAGRMSDHSQRGAAPTGWVHSAGVLQDRSLANVAARDLRAVVQPKSGAAQSLDCRGRASDSRVMVLFSSVASLLGNAGQASYAVANAMLDALACDRAQRGAAGASVIVGVAGLHRKAHSTRG